MLVWAPWCKPGQVVEDFARIRVEDMRTVPVDEDSGVVVVVVCIAPDVRAPLDDEDVETEFPCQTIR